MLAFNENSDDYLATVISDIAHNDYIKMKYASSD